MANKFQNRLVGIIILVVLGVVILPGLLNVKKHYQQGESASIPLVLTPSSGDKFNVVPSLCQRSPSQTLERHWIGKGAVEPSNSTVAQCRQ